MPSSTLPVTFAASPLPLGFSGAPQQFMDALVARLSIQSQAQYSLFVIGNTAPTSNVGPWLNGGIAWYVWDSVSGSYIPIPVTPAYPFRAQLSADQDIVFAAAGTQSINLIFTENIDPNNVFGGSLFSAPIAGIYNFTLTIRIGYPAGAPAPVTTLFLTLNGVNLPYDSALLVTPEQGMLSVSTKLSLSAGDVVGGRVQSAAGAAGTVRVNVTGTIFHGNLVQKT